MKAVFVNQCHPGTPHVCAVRLREFARAMARRKHQVVLLSETLQREDAGDDVDGLERRLAGHDWEAPLHVACRPAPALLLGRLHDGTLPFGLRQAAIAAGYLVRGGVSADWADGSRDASAALARLFKPDVVWATFGCTDAWNIARRLAGAAGCPWVADIKDGWETFIPFGLRTFLAGRYADAARFTALSQAHAEIAGTRFNARAAVIYSGVPDAAGRNESSRDPSGPFRIVAAGSIYDGAAFTAIVQGIADWLARGGRARPIEFRYFGNDHERVAATVGPLASDCRIEVQAFVETAVLEAELSGASVIVYPRHPPALYHHKFMEYLATGRTVLSLPGETEECRTIARAVNAPLHCCDSPGDVAAALASIEAGGGPSIDRERLAGYSWDAQAALLEQVLLQAAYGA